MRGDEVYLCPWTTEAEAEALLTAMGVDPYGVRAMVPKMCHLNILVPHVPAREANIIKQEMLSLGGDAAVSRGTVGCTDPFTDVLIMGTHKQVARWVEKMACQPEVLKRLAQEVRELLLRDGRACLTWKTSQREITLGQRTMVMGILNCTPDSFSDGGLYFSTEQAIARGQEMIDEGAQVIDIGGESSRPGAAAVSVDEELRRTIPVVAALARIGVVPLSIDTMKAKVARKALEAGAEIINDISALTYDTEMTAVVAQSGAGCVLMHMRGLPKTMQGGDLTYRDVVRDVIGYLRTRLIAAETQGITGEQCACDPGIGFGKTVADNYQLLRRLEEFNVLGRPLVVGVSRKSLIGAITGDEPQSRLEGTAAAVTAAILAGAHVVRVHDVKEMSKVVAVADALRYGVQV